MLGFAFVVVSGILVLGFYGYVLAQFYRENQRYKFRSRFVAPGTDDSDLCSNTAASQKTYSRKLMRRETLIHLALAVSGLVGLFLEIELLNSLVTAVHSY